MSVMRVGLIGNPVDHSRSPKMQNAAFAALGMNHVYQLWHTEDDDVEARVASLRDEDVAGANVTVPHKQAVMPYLDEISETARRIGAVNTIVRDGERLVGHNTDAPGFSASIREKYPDFQPERVMVLGAGGASRAIIVAMQEMGANELLIANRTRNKADELASELGATAIAWDGLESVMAGVNLVVNATCLGWHDEVVVDEETLRQLPADALVADLTYRDTPFLQAGELLGLRTLDGQGMLIHQGVRAFEMWFGVTPPVDVMRQASKTD